jgi:amino acid adenylation domain-containing protein
MIRLLQDWPSAQADHRPEAAALVFDGQVTTYGELEAASNRLGRALADSGCGRGDRVALLLPKSPGAVTAMLATLKADCIYVPIDASSPEARIAKILAACTPRFVVASQATAQLLNQLAGAGALPPETEAAWVDEGSPLVPARFCSADVGQLPAHPLDSRNTGSDPAHILFTSGSTGTPKGVVITHANVIHFIEWAVPYFEIQPGDRISGHPPLHFDLSTFDIYGTFAAGAQIHLLRPEVSLLPHRLADFIRESQLTQWFSVPSILHHMAKAGAVRDNDFPGLRRLLWCGEKFPTPALVHWMQRLPHVSFTNLYGPTETTIASSFYRVPSCPAEETVEVPIGEACGGETLLVLDETLRPTPAGETGDLYIAGVGLSPGYWNDPDKTAQVFISTESGERIYKTGDLAWRDAGGMVYLVGRSDTQIKSRGYRIELGEVEAALHAIPGLADAAVVAIDSGGFEGAVICCAYVAAPGASCSPLELKKRLARALPHYMLPSRWLALCRMPLNGNGKTARPVLKEMFLDNSAASAASPGSDA